MIFNSLQFLFFFPTVVFLFYALPRVCRLPLLLFASCFFYMVFIPSYILILFALILVDFVIAIYLEKMGDGRMRTCLFYVSLISNLGMLFLFKYYNFVGENIYFLLDTLHVPYTPRALAWILPIGLSFHTFQSLSYTIEVFYRRQRAELNLAVYSLYVLFFPQMVAGPIERPHNLLPQFKQAFFSQSGTPFDTKIFVSGLQLMLWGFFKKIVIADRLTLLVDQVYRDPRTFSGPPLVLATLFFAFQIYCDFSGYTDIARGAAKILGFELMKNFDYPYIATSISEFWRRWHISLSTWFRDYLYIPLGGNRGSRAKTYVNIMTVFFLSGLWHGARLTFLVWGGLHGLYLISSLLWARVKLNLNGEWLSRLSQFPLFIQRLLTFGLVCFAWIFFRADSVHDGFYVVGNLGRGWTFSSDLLLVQWRNLGAAAAEIFPSLILIGVLIVVEALQRSSKEVFPIGSRHWIWQWAYSYSLIFSIIFFGVFTEKQFIYFQF